jgi:hypothetical protein
MRKIGSVENVLLFRVSHSSRFCSESQELYVSSTKRQKMSISRSIVEAVRSLDPPGRFLEKDPNTMLWSDIGHKKAVEKTSQALRDGAASLRKQLSADMGDPGFLNAVFDVVDADPKKDDAKKEDKAKEKIKKKENEKENERGKATGKEKETEDKDKAKASDKSKLSKVRSKSGLHVVVCSRFSILLTVYLVESLRQNRCQ